MDYQVININESSKLALFDLRNLQIENKREKEAVGVKLLLSNLFNDEVELAYYDTGKPHLKNRTEEISISHSHDMLAIIVDKQKPTGIDIELIRDKVLKITHKFLSDNELKNIAGQSIEKVLVYWAAKETLYKINKKKNVDFRVHLFIANFDYSEKGGELIANIVLHDFEKEIKLKYMKVDEYILVYPI